MIKEWFRHRFVPVVHYREETEEGNVIILRNYTQAAIDRMLPRLRSSTASWARSFNKGVHIDLDRRQR